jgi:hypothetical protein
MQPPESMPSVEEFEVPDSLADLFSVRSTEEVVQVAEKEGPGQNEQQAKASAKATSAKAPAAKASTGSQRGKATVKSPQKGAKVKEPEPWPNRWSMEPFFQVGERYRFDVTYFGATAGELVIETLPPKIVADRKSYHIRATARTASVFTLFYRLNDVAESFMDAAGLFSHKFSLKLDESLQQRDVLELYDQRNHKVHYWSKLDHKRKGKHNETKEIETEPFTQDGISAFFYVRTLPLNVGDVYNFPVVTNGKLRNVRAEVVRKEVLKTRIGNIPSIVVRPDVVLDGVLKTHGDSFVWISDDPRRIILKVDAKIKVGSIIAYLREHSYGAVQPASAR